MQKSVAESLHVKLRTFSFDSFGCRILVIKDDNTIYKIIPNNEVEGGYHHGDSMHKSLA